jgi:DNA-binding CsgD family transcriptional regulator
MRDWTLLKQHLPRLSLQGKQREVARYLVEGRSTQEIATLTGLAPRQVKFNVAMILYLLGRLPPDAAETVSIATRPGPSPLKPGIALRLPD